MDTPSFIYRDGMIADQNYLQWISEVKRRFRNAQAKAAVRVNTAMLEFYWSIGRDLVALKAEEKWGAGVVKQFSLDMRQAFPDETGFSLSNVKYMKRWYAFYFNALEKSQQAVDLLDDVENHHADDFLLKEKSQHVVDQIDFPEDFGKIPWGQHIQIISKATSLDEALFYIRQTIEENWSRSMLEDKMKANLYGRQGKAITNFDQKLSSEQCQIAKDILKDPYNFEFLTMRERYEEKELEDALVTNITHFLLEMGKGFAFVGRQMELRMDDGTSFFPDLVFYHIPQKRYVVIELKTVEFKPEFAGKINFYVTAADELLKGIGDNPSVGLIICKSAKKTIVEWSLKDIAKPLGVATYQLQEVVDRTVAELKLRKKG